MERELQVGNPDQPLILRKVHAWLAVAMNGFWGDGLNIVL